jgi:hypothetical protein
VVLTFVILNWLLDKVSGIIGPNTLVGDLLSFGGGVLVGSGHSTLSFVVGLSFALVGIWGIGLLAKSLAREMDPIKWTDDARPSHAAGSAGFFASRADTSCIISSRLSCADAG